MPAGASDTSPLSPVWPRATRIRFSRGRTPGPAGRRRPCAGRRATAGGAPCASPLSPERPTSAPADRLSPALTRHARGAAARSPRPGRGRSTTVSPESTSGPANSTVPAPGARTRRARRARAKSRPRWRSPASASDAALDRGGAAVDAGLAEAAPGPRRRVRRADPGAASVDCVRTWAEQPARVADHLGPLEQRRAASRRRTPRAARTRARAIVIGTAMRCSPRRDAQADAERRLAGIGGRGDRDERSRAAAVEVERRPPAVEQGPRAPSLVPLSRTTATPPGKARARSTRTVTRPDACAPPAARRRAEQGGAGEQQQAGEASLHSAAAARASAASSSGSSSAATVRRSITTRSSATRATTGGDPARNRPAKAVGAHLRRPRARPRTSAARVPAPRRRRSSDSPAITAGLRAGAVWPSARANAAARSPSAAAPRCEHAQHGHALARAAVLVLDQRGVERGQRHLVDAQRPVERVAAHPVHDRGAPDDQPRLRSAEQLVAAEGHGVGALRQRAAQRRLGLPAAPAGASTSAAALVLDQGHGVLARERRQLLERRLLGEADHAEVARVHLEDQGGVGPDRGAVVREPRAVGGAHLAQPRAALAQHVRDAERAADLHQLAAAHDHLAALRQRVDGQQHRRRAVVDHHAGLDPEQRLQPRLGVLLAAAAAAALEVVLEVAVGRGDLGHAGRRAAPTAARARGSCGPRRRWR